MEKELIIIDCIVFAFSLTMAWTLMPRIISISYHKHLVDMPNGRKIHDCPVPRLGGVSFFPLILMSLFLFNGLCVLYMNAHIDSNDTNTFLQMQFFGIGITLLYLIGVADDLVGVNFRVKFLVQILAGILLPLSGFWLHSLGGFLGIYEIPAWVGMPLTVFLVVYITNGINLIDGVDGLASGIALMAITLYAFIFVFLHKAVYASICLSSIGVLSVFFYFNVFGGEHKRVRKLFMGDTGSLTLGYLICYLMIVIANYHGHRFFTVTGPLFVALSPLIIPLLDILRVMAARRHDHVPLFYPDKRHIHHKLMRTGLSSRWTMVILLLLTLYFIGLNVALSQFLARGTIILIANLTSWFAMHFVINYFIRRNRAVHPETEAHFRDDNGFLVQY